LTHLKTRVITAVVAAPVVLAIIVLYGNIGLGILVLAVVLCGLREFRRMLKASGIEIYWLLIGLFSCAFAFLSTDIKVICLILLTSILAVLLRGLLSRGEPPVVLTEVAFSVFALVFLPFLASFVVSLGAIPNPEFPEYSNAFGLQLVVLLLVLTWACDIAAYFCGRRWGKHKALERISPNKTVEGFVAGIAASTLASILLCAFFDLFSIGYAAILGLLLGVFGQLGDFWVSLVKRAAGQKDAGALLPGHGGILDRMDSLLFNAPVMYVFATTVLDKAL